MSDLQTKTSKHVLKHPERIFFKCGLNESMGKHIKSKLRSENCKNTSVTFLELKAQ